MRTVIENGSGYCFCEGLGDAVRRYILDGE